MRHHITTIYDRRACMRVRGRVDAPGAAITRGIYHFGCLHSSRRAALYSTGSMRPHRWPKEDRSGPAAAMRGFGASLASSQGVIVSAVRDCVKLTRSGFDPSGLTKLDGGIPAHSMGGNLLVVVPRAVLRHWPRPDGNSRRWRWHDAGFSLTKGETGLPGITIAW